MASSLACCIVVHYYSYSLIILLQTALDRSLEDLGRDPTLMVGPEGLERFKQQHILHTWQLSDAQEVDSEVRRVKEHAMQVLYQLIRHKNEDDGKLSALQRRVKGELRAEDQGLFEEHLRSLFEAAEETVRRLHAHEERKEQISPQEYSELLRNLDKAVGNTAYVIQKIEEKLGKQSTPLTHDEAMQLLSGLEPGGGQQAGATVLQQARMKERVTVEALRRQRESNYNMEHIQQDVEGVRCCGSS